MGKRRLWRIVIPLIVIASLLSANVLRLVLWTLMVIGLVALVRTARSIGEPRATREAPLAGRSDPPGD